MFAAHSRRICEVSLTISEVAGRTGLSADTLRYYERIRLLPAPARTAGGQRSYDDRDIARLLFIGRAKAIGFSLSEIGELLKFREDPAGSSRAVRELAAQKHTVVVEQLAELQAVENELALLLNLCRGAPGDCPILNKLDGDAGTRNQ